MLVMIALIYLLLGVRIQVQMEISFSDWQGNAAIGIGAYGVHLRRDYKLEGGSDVLFVRAVPRYGGKKQRKKAQPASEFVGRFMRTYVLRALRSGRFSGLMLHLRMGLGDACATAVAAGTAHAVFCALLARTGNECDLRILPEFSQICLCMHMRGIFSCWAGDIMLAALKAACRKRREGLKWINIPLRA